MDCSNCGFENLDGMKFCGGCGTALQNRCPQCNFDNPSQYQFCGQCGTPLTGQKPTVSPDQPTRPVVEQTHPVPVEPATDEPHARDAERRQLTVMFCDLVGSTSLSGQLDPEDLREVVQAYQSTCTNVIERFEGYVAQHLGDGILCYFGYPTAHEDDAQRAVRTGLGIIDAMKTLNQRLKQNHGVQLAVRISIHTGVVVVGGIGAGVRQEQLALGETPNVAARIQELSKPDTVIISADTHRLIQGYFDCDVLGEHELRGVSQPIAVYRILQESGAQGRLDIASTRGLTPLVGREQEVGLLLERWEQAQNGQGQVVLLSGEAGIGKSRLVQVLKDHVSSDGLHTRLECRSSPYFTNSALYPIIDMVQRTLRFQTDDTPEQKVAKLEENLSQYWLPLEETVLLFGVLLSLPVPEDRYPSLNLSPQLQRQKTLEAIVAIVLELSERQPLLFVLEDLHWTDPTTLEFIDMVIDQVPTTSMCMLLTCRPEFDAPWSSRSYLTQVTLNRLSRYQIEQMTKQIAGGKGLPVDVIQQLLDKTDGVPLYIEEMTKAVLESGALKDVDGHYELTGSIGSLSIPATLQDSLMSRLDRLATAKPVAQYASVIGRQFSYELLHAASQLDETMLQLELGRLVDAELIYQRGLPPHATYIFKHALIQDTAYESLLRSTRQRYHQRIAQTLEERFPETTETQPELLAHHYTQAGLNEHAIGYWQHAGEQAVERSANVEAVAHLNKGLELLTTLRGLSERPHQELDLLIILGPALIATKGYIAPEVEQAYNRAYELCRDIGKETQRFSVLSGLRRFYFVRGDFNTARDIGNELLTLAQRQQDSTLLLEAYWALGGVLFQLGEFVLVQQYLEQAVAIFESQSEHSQSLRHGTVPGIHCLSWLSMASWMLGFPERALQQNQQALALARQQTSHFVQHICLMHAVSLHHYRREASLILENIESAKISQTDQTVANQNERTLSVLERWALFMTGKRENVISSIHSTLYTSVFDNYKPYLFCVFAEIYGKANQIGEGISALDEGFALVEQIGAYFYESELHRLKGQLLLSQFSDNQAEAESSFQQAIATAQSQSAKSWELRAATSLARLWQNQGKRDEAYELLEPVYNWFTEGFDTVDLIDAKALLDELSEGR